MRLLVTGASGLVGSNLAAAAAQQSWKVLGTWCETPVRIPGARTARLDVSDRHACVALAEEFEPDVVVHAAASVELSRLEREPRLAQLNQIGTEHTLGAARAVRGHYVLVSSDWVFSGQRPVGQCWSEHDSTEPVNAYGRSKLAAELTVQDYSGSWLITRPANVYGVNLSVPSAVRRDDRALADSSHSQWSGPAMHSRHVWERSSLALRWVAHLRVGQLLPAPADIYQCPTYAWDYAQRVCELIAQQCEGVYNTAGPDALSRRDYLRLLARAFDCDPALVSDGTTADFLAACGEDTRLKLPSNTTLCDEQATFVLGRPAVDPLAGHRLMRAQLDRVLGCTPAIKEVSR
ncbi:MAG TPA: sugar nucleotide-binding protein [Solirubrobacteraceae bacterium]|jgi:dTDP-4-dehydrorhamnose reductase